MDTVTQRRTFERGYLLTCILAYMYSCICRERAEKRKKKKERKGHDEHERQKRRGD